MLDLVRYSVDGNHSQVVPAALRLVVTINLGSNPTASDFFIDSAKSKARS
jgi:hypothetical protein